MTIQQIIKKYSDIEIDLLLSHVLGKPKEFLYTHPEKKLTKLQYFKVLKLLQRRKKGEPIAYILGYKYFYGLKFKVNKNVLIPRPETEWLVERVLNLFPFLTAVKKGNKSNILDLGTGSGCIAISVAKRVTLLQQKGYPFSVIATDVSKKALAVAKANAKMHKANIKFIQSDLFNNIEGKFDIITANLPYVPQGMYELLYNNLKYEPKLAITDGSEVWEIYQRFFAELRHHLRPKGVALLEIDDGAKPTLQKMIKKLLPGWQATFYKDLRKFPRYLVLRPKH